MVPLQTAHELPVEDAVRFLDLRLLFGDRHTVGRTSRKLTNRFYCRRQNIPGLSRGALCAFVKKKTTFKNRAGRKFSATNRAL